MGKMNRKHLFNVAGDGLFFILIAFSYRKVLKMSQAGSFYYH